MNVVIRIVVTLICGVATFYFVFWTGSPLTVLSLHLPFWISGLGSFLVAAGVAWYVWAHTASFQISFINAVLLGAIVVGGIGFSTGFFLPLLFASSSGAAVGSLFWGLLILGPLGFLLGAVGGVGYWLAWGRCPAQVEKPRVSLNWPKTDSK